MKLTSLSKSARAIGLMVLLSVMVGTSMQQSAQAQTESIPDGIKFLTREQLEQGRRDALEHLKICDRVWQENSNSQEDGRPFFDDFQGLTLTDAQKKAYKALDAQAEARRTELYKQTISVADPSATVEFLYLSPTVSRNVRAAIQTELDRKPTMDQLEAINRRFEKRFGKQYGFFVGSYVTYLTPQQKTQLAQISSDFYNRVQALMTPEQQPQYSKNLAARLRINAACDAKQPISSYPALGRIVNQPSSTNAAQPKTIVDIAAANPNFSTLVTALRAAGLTATLSGKTPFTVFAPTNQAFAALPKGTLERLLRPENRATLREVLTYHVVSGAVESKALRSGKVATVQGSTVGVRANRDRIQVNNARVTSADVKANNGVIHVIDRVLLPPNLK